MVCQGKKIPLVAELDRMVTFCYDRFDLCDGQVCLCKNNREYIQLAIYANRWRKRAEKLAQLREWVQL